MYPCREPAISLRCAMAAALLLASATSSESFEIKQYISTVAPASGQRAIRSPESSAAPVALLPERTAASSPGQPAAAENKFRYPIAIPSIPDRDDTDATD